MYVSDMLANKAKHHLQSVMLVESHSSPPPKLKKVFFAQLLVTVIKLHYETE
jgi:hypothetical protein